MLHVRNSPGALRWRQARAVIDVFWRFSLRRQLHTTSASVGSIFGHSLLVLLEGSQTAQLLLFVAAANIPDIFVAASLSFLIMNHSLSIANIKHSVTLELVQPCYNYDAKF